MIIKQLEDIPIRKEQAIIINVGTKLPTTLAILSVIKYIDMPLLLINCAIEKNGTLIDDTDYFINLQNQYNFDLINLPLKTHGDTLDYLFTRSKAENILLVDSDIEVLNQKAILFMRSYISLWPNTFGSGFIHGPRNRLLFKKNSYYFERMWIPFTYLNVKKIREALSANQSFNIVIKYNDFPYSQFISKRIYKIENKYNLKLKFLNIFRKKYGHNRKPSFVLRDTGANIYHYLKNIKEYNFIGPSSIVSNLYVFHYDGISRNTLDSSDYTAQSLSEVSEKIKNRLKDKYHFNINI